MQRARLLQPSPSQVGHASREHAGSRQGRQPKHREAHPDKVRSIRREFANRSTGKMVAYADLGAKYGISDDGVRRIIYGETWAWLE